MCAEETKSSPHFPSSPTTRCSLFTGVSAPQTCPIRGWEGEGAWQSSPPLQQLSDLYPEVYQHCEHCHFEGVGGGDLLLHFQQFYSALTGLLAPCALSRWRKSSQPPPLAALCFSAGRHLSPAHSVTCEGRPPLRPSHQCRHAPIWTRGEGDVTHTHADAVGTVFGP